MLFLCWHEKWVSDSQFFVYINNYVLNISDLNDVRLKFSIMLNDIKHNSAENKFSDFLYIMIRTHFCKYDEFLKLSHMTLIENYVFLSMFLKTDNYIFYIELWLSDECVLFCFEIFLFLQKNAWIRQKLIIKLKNIILFITVKCF